MHASHTQELASNIWSFANPIRTDRAQLMITDENGQTLSPTKTKVTRDYISLAFATESCGRVWITDCMDEV